MSEKHKNFVWRSTDESREKRIPSVLAIAETFLMVIATWWMAWYFDSYLHIYIAICIAPLLLLKTPESIKQANRWFLHKIKFADDWKRDKKFWLFILLVMVITVAISYPLAIYLLADLTGWSLFWSAFGVGVVVVVVGVGGVIGIIGGVGVGVGVGIGIVGVVGGGVIGGVGIVGGVIGVVVGIVVVVVGVGVGGGGMVVFGIPVAIGYLIRSVVIKILITTGHLLRHPIRAITRIPYNYDEQWRINDVFYSPELLPEIGKKTRFFQLSGLVKGFSIGGIGGKIIIILVIPFWSLGYLYRWSIKSTAWLYWPLAYLVNVEALTNELKSQKAIANRKWKVMWEFHFIGFGMLLLYFLGDDFLKSDLAVLLWNEVWLDPLVKGIQHLQLMEFFVAGIVLYWVWYLYFSYLKNQGHHEIPTHPYHQTALHWLARLHTVTWYIYFGYNLGIFFQQHLFDELNRLVFN